MTRARLAPAVRAAGRIAGLWACTVGVASGQGAPPWLGGGDDPDAERTVVHVASTAGPTAWTSAAGPAAGPDVAFASAGVGGQCSGLSQVLRLNAEGAEGDAPAAVAYLADGSRYLVAGRDSRNLTEFDAATGAFVRAIPLGGSPQDLAVAPDGTRAIATGVFEDGVSFVDLAGGAEVAWAGGVDLPAVARITADSQLAVVGAVASQELVVYDLASAVELRRVGGLGFAPALSIAPEAGAIALSVDQLALVGRTAVHADQLADELDLIDLDTGAVVSLPTLAAPRGLALTPDGSRAVLSHVGADAAISLIDVAGASVLKTVALPVGPTGPIAVDHAGTVAVVAVPNGVVVVDLQLETVGAELPTGIVNRLLTTADGVHVLAVGFDGSLIDFATGSIVASLNGEVVVGLGAVSPIAPEAVLVGTLFGEDRLQVDTSGAPGPPLFQGYVGEGLEADATRRVAVSLDGQRAVTTNILSDTASVWDLPGRSLLGVVAVGNRPGDVEITPDGSTAIVANLESDFATLIDLATLAVTEVPISIRGIEVEVAPDGAWAYVAVATDGDGVWRINLGTGAAVGGKLATADMGAISYSYAQSSDLSLSPDGSRLVACGSFDNRITLIDTVAWSILGEVDVGGFPVRATWSVDGSRCYVACRDSNEVVEVLVGSGAPVVGTSIAVGSWPFEMAATLDGTTLYVLEYLDRTVGRIDLASGTRVGGAPLLGFPSGLAVAPAGDRVYASTGGWSVDFGPATFSIATFGALVVVDTATLLPLHVLDNGWGAADLAATVATDRLAVTSPRGDGLGFLVAGQALTADVESLSVAAGGTQALCLDAGPGQAGQLYVVLGSASGTTPGLTLDGVDLPLNVDAYTLFTLASAGTAPFVGTIGLLDGLGEAKAQVVLPAAGAPSLVGARVDHAFAAADPVFGIVGFASSAVGLEFAP